MHIVALFMHIVALFMHNLVKSFIEKIIKEKLFFSKLNAKIYREMQMSPAFTLKLNNLQQDLIRVQPGSDLFPDRTLVTAMNASDWTWIILKDFQRKFHGSIYIVQFFCLMN